jgi:hypothetical protein
MIKMEKQDVKSLDNEALKMLYSEVFERTQSQLATDEKVDFEDISYLYSIENEIRVRGMVIKKDGVQQKKRARESTREERTIRRIDRTLSDMELQKTNRKKFTKWMVWGIFLFMIGMILTMTNVRYIYSGAILTGIGIFSIGVYGLATEK